jgi:Pregnancy-associated plasma protein-A/FG-GAP-like repeat
MASTELQKGLQAESNPPKNVKEESLRKNLCYCATDQLDAQLLVADPGYKSRRQAVEQFARLARTAPSTRTGQVHIPVVVHVIYSGGENSPQKILDAQIHEQIRVLNEDYNSQNADLSKLREEFKNLIGNPNIRFFLAARDPEGKPTTGIRKEPTRIALFGDDPNQLDQRMKFKNQGGDDGWPADEYLNIWVCNLDGLLGYATFPGMGSIKEDGVVIDYRAFGVGGSAADPFNLGRTATHEVGHWLNLRHIWGDDQNLARPGSENFPNLVCSRGDFVDDTPNCAGPNFNKPEFPSPSCGNKPNGDLFYNYMDYCDDDICIMFTKGQVERMNATLAGPRSTLLGSDFSNIRAQTKTGLPETKDDSMHFLVHAWNKVGEKDLIAINKTNMDLHIMSAESKHQTDVFSKNGKKSIGFTAATGGASSELAFGFGKWTGDAKADLFVVQSSPVETTLDVLSAESSYQTSALHQKIKLRFPGPVYSIAVAPWSKDSKKPDLIVLQKPSIRLDSYSVLITVLSGSSDFKTTKHVFTTHALDNSSSSLDLQLADWNGDGTLDLVAIKKSNTSKKATTVTVLSGHSGFTDVIFKTSTFLGGTERNFTFLCGDWNGDGRVDLIGVKKWDTDTKGVEVHVLAG